MPEYGSSLEYWYSTPPCASIDEASPEYSPSVLSVVSPGVAPTTTLPPPSAAGRTKFGLPTRSPFGAVLMPSLATITPWPGSVARPALVIAGALIVMSASGSINGLSCVPQLCAVANGFPVASADLDLLPEAAASVVILVSLLTAGPVGAGS